MSGAQPAEGSDSMRQRLRDLPFELNGTAPPPTEPATADEGDALRRERRWAGLLRDATVQRAHQARAHAGAERLDQLLRADRADETAAPRPAAPAPRRGWFERLSFTMTPSLSAALMVAFVSAAVVIGLWVPGDGADDERFRGADAPVTGAQAPALRVLFREDARESDLRQMLLAQRMVVVAGPTTMGEYWLRPGEGSTADLQAVAQTLLASGLATHAVVDERGGPGRH